MKRLVCALLLFAFASIASIAYIRTASGQAGAKAYKGTITLKRTNTEPDNNVNELVQFANVVLNGRANAWMNSEPPMTVVSVSNINTGNPTISVPRREFKPTDVGISLMIEARKTYSVTVGPISKIPASISAGGEKPINDFWDIQGETANDIPMPADPSQLKGSKTIKDTSGATVVLSWDLKLS